MTEKLQKKFIVTAMTAISVLLTVLLGWINIINMLYSVHESTLLLDALCQSVTETNTRFPPEDGETVLPPKSYTVGALWEELFYNYPDTRRETNQKEHLFDPHISKRAKLSAVYFITVLDNGSDTPTVYSAHAAVTQNEAEKLTELAVSRGKEAARTPDYRYKMVRLINGKNAIVFLDLTEYRRNNLRTLVISILVDAVCWGLMLLLVVRLSKRAIRPFAENISRQKQFVTDAGHELKTPLAIILANTDALELHHGESKWSRNIRSQVTRLSGLTQNLLTLARADESSSPTDAEEFSLSDLVTGTVEMFIEPAAQRGLQFETDICPDVNIHGNMDMISRLVSILTDNAVKYAVEGSEIRVSVTATDKQRLLKLTNRCEALPDCPPEKLFDRFYRNDASRAYKENGGYGVGLSAALAIVRLHKGTLTASYGNDSEITFTVKL